MHCFCATHITQAMEGTPTSTRIAVNNSTQKEVMEMKRMIALLLVIVMCVPLAACNSDKKAFEVSKAAYDNIDIAYEITEQFGSDLYEAWRLGIYEKDEVIDGGAKYLATELSLSADEIRAGAAYTIVTMLGEDWEEMSDADKDKYIGKADSFFAIMEDDLFSFCVMSVTGAYTLNGKVEEAQTSLDTAKAQMKELSQEHSDYEHYPNLKGYYTTTSSFFDFCNNPTGSFEQVKDTVNDYKNEARDYISDLDYIFEE